MPTYEYRCKSCGYHFERFQSIKDEPIKKCPQCGGIVQKLFSPGIGLIFKGSGFYITDYKNKGVSPSNGNGKHKTTDKSVDKKTEPDSKVEASKEKTKTEEKK